MARNIESFFEKIDKSDDENGCWKWQAALDGNDYGIFCVFKTNFRAHRFSYEWHKGLIPKGMMVCHTCDNPPCVNPDHLFLGTAKDNAQDMVKKGRNRTRVLTKKQKLSIRNSLRKRYYNRIGLIKYLAFKFGVLPGTIRATTKR